MKKILCAAAACLCLTVSASVFAALTPGEKMAVEALVKQFTAAEFDTRQKAVDRLIEMGPDVAPVVRKALAETVDNEVKLRCEMVLKGLKDKFPAAAVDGPKAAPPAAPAVHGPVAKLDFAPRKLTMEFKGENLANALNFLATLSGNAPLAVPKDLPDKTVTLDLKDAGYFEALDGICEAAGLTYGAVSGSATLSAPQKPRNMGEYCGPGTVKVAQIQKTNSFRDASYPDSRGITVWLSSFWEDRLPVVADACEVTRAVTDDGRALELRQRRVGQFAIGPCNSGARGNVSARGVSVRFQNVPDRGESKTFQVEGKFALSLGAGEKTLVIPNVLVERDPSAEEGDVAFKVTKVWKAAGGGGVTINMGGRQVPAAQQIQFSIDITRAGGMVAMGNGSPYGVFLVDPAGKRYPSETASGMQQAKGDAWTATLYVSFQKPEKLDNTWSLVYVYPEHQESKEWPFKIKDLPLP